MFRVKWMFILWTIFFVAIASIIAPAKKEAAPIGVTARNAILMEQESGRIIFEKAAHDKHRIASITKVMTSILAVESGKLDEMVTVSNKAVRTEGSSIYLKPGEKIKLEHLVYGLMLRSGNDSAVAIAEHVGGSLEGFVYLMNQKAAEIGMLNTEFANPHGLDDHENHYSTAYDMAMLTRYAMNNEKFQEIFGTKVHKAPGPPDENWDRNWTNKHRLVTGMYSYTTGGKTGFTKRAKRTLISTAEKNGLQLIAVTLHDPDDWKDHIFMFNRAFQDYQLYNLASKGTLKLVKDDFYKNKVKLDRDVNYPLTSKERENVRINISMLTPEKSWDSEESIPDVVGKFTIISNDEVLTEVPIYYDKEDEPKKSFWSLFKDIFFIFTGMKTDG
ncbi:MULTISPECIES: D-alanyl-D-alanine carboxypeptidase family protein [Bacillus]|uniref:D-alanyl-D-alanine carboxypeptidase family protein n=1 Tax=Bacillus TaxID=1386 RepID=UPI001D0D1B01|nr:MULTISPECIES: D-alanyl-D-alanine carboxypeptidase family protein [Bacillus]